MVALPAVPSIPGAQSPQIRSARAGTLEVPITSKGGGPKNPSPWLCRAWHIPCEQSCCPRPGTHSVAPSVPACFWQPAGFPGHRAQPPLPKIRLEQEGWSWNWGSNRLLGAEGMVLGLVLVCLGPTTAGDGHEGNGNEKKKKEKLFDILTFRTCCLKRKKVINWKFLLYIKAPLESSTEPRVLPLKLLGCRPPPA